LLQRNAEIRVPRGRPMLHQEATDVMVKQVYELARLGAFRGVAVTEKLVLCHS
jgi:hypothetical protein